MIRRTLVLGFALAAALPAAASAAEFPVTSTADGAGSCAPGSPTCTLRQALADAKALPGRDVVRVPPGTYDLTGPDLIVGIGDAVDVIGTDPRTTVLREVSGGDGRVFLVEQDASLRLEGLTLTGSRDASAVLLFGGGNELRAANLVLAGNTAPRGAGIDATAGSTVLLDAVTLHGNVASDRGGAIRVTGAGASVTMTRSTVSENSAPVGSGIAVSSGSATLGGVTLAGGAGPGADLDVAPGASAAVRGTVIGSCAGAAPSSLGHNLDAGGACGLAGPGDRAGLDPLLGPLGPAGGTTPVRVPGAGSPLVDADAGCSPGAADQRGVLRPQGAACDIGAVEVAVAPVAPPPVTTPPVVEPPRPAPRLTRLALSPSRFRVGPASRGRGTRVSVRLTRAATLRLRVERARPGRRVGGRCRVPGSSRVPASRRCTRWVLVRGAIERRAPAGSSALRFSGRIGGRALRPGRHRLVVSARSGDGPRGPARRAAFRIR
jgi:hypothetical protein